MQYKKYLDRIPQHLFSVPFIYFMIVPLIFLDLCLEMYQNICFRLYRILLLKRSEYFKIDRYKLKYLTRWERLNCAYCGYGNGLAQYFSAMAAASEKYWCGIKHATDLNFKVPVHHRDFIEYGDKKAYKDFEK